MKSREKSMRLGIEDQRFLDAAEGWLDPGNPQEANEELERITPKMRAHPDVLCARWRIYAAARKWEQAAEIAKIISEVSPDVPFGFINMVCSARIETSRRSSGCIAAARG
jgi:hypothetical protein